MKKNTAAAIAALLSLAGCREDYAKGERIGLITQFSRSGLIWKTWEGHLNMTQTGMNSSQPFDFSIDRDNEKQSTIDNIDSAAQHGWKVKLKYHEVAFKNITCSRGETDHFIDAVEVLDKNVIHNSLNDQRPGHIIDTIYLVIREK